MAFREVTGGDTIDIKNQKDEPFEGVYVGKKDITTEIGPQVIWRFKKGATVTGIYGFTNLNKAMEAICEGALVRVTYTGQKECKTKFGVKPVHQCKVEVDDSYAGKADVDEDL